MLELNRMVHEPARLMILSCLDMLKEADFMFLLHETELTRGNLSTHLSKLEGVGYLSIERTYRGKVPLMLVRLTPEGRKALDTYRKQMRKLL